MAFYLIGTGMNSDSIGADALKILKTCDKVYLENYTVNFPYKIEDLEKAFNQATSDKRIAISPLSRESVEDESILEEAKNSNVALLVYGDSLSATTHTQLMLEAKKQGIESKVFHNASIMTTIAETGLQLYKFGKTASMPNWKEHTNKPTSFMNYIKENQSIKAHTLILTDIGLEIKNAMEQLKESSDKTKIPVPEKIIAISSAGTDSQKIFYDTPDNLANLNRQPATGNRQPQAQNACSMPFCLIIPGELNHMEQEAIEELKE